MAKKPLIMIVEDEKDVADSIGQPIKSTNKYDVVIVYSAKDALKQISKTGTFMGIGSIPIRLILLDIKMPEMDGLQFLSELRKEHPPDSVGVIIISAWEDKEKFAKAREGSVAGYLIKPFNNDDLLFAIDRFFEGKSKWMIEQTKWETIGKEEKLEL
jgi:DNA-binding response OmpR family regulator